MPILSVRLTEEEKSALEKSAEISGYTKSAMMKFSFFGKENVSANKRPSFDRIELAKIAGHLGKIGSNLNQITRALNTNKKSIPDDLNLVLRNTKVEVGNTGVYLSRIFDKL